MLGINVCRIDARLTQWLEEAMSDIERLEESPGRCPLRVADRFVAAQAAWIEHKMTCMFCCCQQFGKVH